MGSSEDNLTKSTQKSQDQEQKVASDNVLTDQSLFSYRCQTSSPEALQADEIDQDADDHIRQPRHKLSVTMARTIQELEHLLEEAVKLAEKAGSAEEFEEVQGPSQKRPQSPSRQPTQALATKISIHLEEASSKSKKLSAAAKDNLDQQADLSAPESFIEKKEQEPDAASRDKSPKCKGACSAGDLRILPPKPIVEPLEEKHGHLSRSRRSPDGQPRKLLKAPQVGPRTTSARIPKSIDAHSPPTLKLNDVELKHEGSEEKDHVLPTPRQGHERHFTQIFGIQSRQASINLAHATPWPWYEIDLSGVQHVDLPDKPDDLDVHSTCHHAPVARNWPNSRKRFAA